MSGKYAQRTERKMRRDDALKRMGLRAEEIGTLERAAARLHRWAEWQCGVTEGHVEQDDAGQWWEVRHSAGREVRRRVNDLGAVAWRRVVRVWQAHPDLVMYNQTDPRGCALYILRRADVGDADIARVYSRGVAVCV